MKTYLVTRHEDEVIVAIMKHKTKNTYSYVNFTKGHICPCEFKSEDEAIQDMDRLKASGDIVGYEELKLMFKNIKPKRIKFNPDEELYQADPKCDHYIIPASGGGIKCIKCGGWFCY